MASVAFADRDQEVPSALCHPNIKYDGHYDTESRYNHSYCYLSRDAGLLPPPLSPLFLSEEVDHRRNDRGDIDGRIGGRIEKVVIGAI